MVFKMVTTLLKNYLLPHHVYRKLRSSKNHLENPVNNQLTMLFKNHYVGQNGCKLKRKKNLHIVWVFFEQFNNEVLQLNDMLLVMSVI